MLFHYLNYFITFLVYTGASKGTPATQNASWKSSGRTTIKKLGQDTKFKMCWCLYNKCSKTHLQASLIQTFFRGDTQIPIKRGREHKGRRGREERLCHGCRGGWTPACLHTFYTVKRFRPRLHVGNAIKCLLTGWLIETFTNLQWIYAKSCMGLRESVDTTDTVKRLHGSTHASQNC